MLIVDRRFAPLAAAHFLTAFNSNFLKNALVFLVLASMAKTDAEAMSSFVSATFMAPMIFLSGLGGQLADRCDRRLLARTLKGLEAASAGVATLGIMISSYWTLLAGLVLLQVVSSLFGPLRSSLIPNLVGKEQVPLANAWIEGIGFAAMVCGLWLVGAAFTADGYRQLIAGGVLAFAAFCFLVVNFIPADTARRSGEKVDWNVFAGTIRVLVELRREAGLFAPVVILGFSWFCSSLALSTAPAMVKRVGGDPIAMSWALILYGLAGSFATQVAARMVRLAAGRLVPVGFAGLATACTLMTVSNSLGIQLVVAAVVLIAVSHSLVLIPMVTVIQTLSRQEWRARAAAASNIVNAIFMVVGGFGVAGLQAAGVDLLRIYGLCGFFCAAAAAITWTARARLCLPGHNRVL